MLRRVAILLAFILTGVTLVSPRAATSVWFVAPWGKAADEGTWESPIDLATALSVRSKAKPGDTLILRDGIYRGIFESELSGAENHPIVIRNAPGNRVTIDGTLNVRGGWVTYWGIEVTNSNPDRTKARPAGVDIFGAHTRFINMVVHDTGVGMGFWAPAVDSEIYGCVIYHNGWQGPDPDRGHGHGIYTQNQIGTKHIEDNIIFDDFGWGIHAYTEGGALSGFHLEGNTAFNNGSATRQGTGYDNILVGGLRPAERIELIRNFTYHAPGKGGSNRLGFAASNQGARIEDNYFAGGASVLGLLSWEKLRVTGNTFCGLQNLLSLTVPPNAERIAYEFSNNTYVGGEPSKPFTFQGKRLDFAGWRQAGQFDQDSQLIAKPSGVRIFVRPNRYEPGRAYVTVYNWDLKERVGVELGNALTAGARYEVRNIADRYGAPVASGKYSGDPITLPLTGSSTGPEFNVFEVHSPSRQ